MRSRPAISLPRPGSPEFTPFLACVALGACLILQVATPQSTQLPDVAGLAPRLPKAPAAQPVGEHKGIFEAAIFAPDRPSADGETEVSDAERQFTVLGTALRKGASAALVRGPDGSSAFLRPGQVFHGWRIASIRPDQVAFAKDGEVKVLEVGAKPPAPKSPTPQAASEPTQ